MFIAPIGPVSVIYIDPADYAVRMRTALKFFKKRRVTKLVTRYRRLADNDVVTHACPSEHMLAQFITAASGSGWPIIQIKYVRIAKSSVFPVLRCTAHELRPRIT